MRISSMDIVNRLAVYGTLAPGKPNNCQLEGLNGFWWRGVVRGTLVQDGWGATMGFPGLVLKPEGDLIEVQVFESEDLADHWLRLDEFEGSGYRRVITTVSSEQKQTSPAWIYVLATTSHA
jgi:gamma-glutamylcyclotransferase (GGCT)/AIG2-like uncharacterized protein YtfP